MPGHRGGVALGNAVKNLGQCGADFTASRENEVFLGFYWSFRIICIFPKAAGHWWLPLKHEQGMYALDALGNGAVWPGTVRAERGGSVWLGHSLGSYQMSRQHIVLILAPITAVSHSLSSCVSWPLIDVLWNASSWLFLLLAVTIFILYFPFWFTDTPFSWCLFFSFSVYIYKCIRHLSKYI